MPLEVYTGSRPGRPRLAIVLCAALLAGALGLAWWQADETKALGPEENIARTPLWARPPKGWIVPSEEPQSFVLPVPRNERRQSLFPFERRIRFEYKRLPEFRSVDQLLRGRLDNSRALDTLRPARIGPYDAIEAHKTVVQMVGRNALPRETIVRLTCLPRGELIVVEYDPLLDLRPADTEILDDVCASLHIEDPTLTGAPDEFLQKAGLRLPLEPNWYVVGTDYPEVPGVYIGGSIDQWPAWSIGIYRTWLASGRTAADLLASVAADRWFDFDAAQRVHEAKGTNGTTVHALRCENFGRSDEPMPAVWIVERSPSQIAILYVFASPHFAAAADEVAQRIASSLEILPLDTLPSISTAEDAGRRLATELTERGAVPRWGREDRATRYRGFQTDSRIEILDRREALGHNAADGYQGSVAYVRQFAGRTVREAVRWRLDGQATAYVWNADRLLGRANLNITETRRDRGNVTRNLSVDGRIVQTTSFNPGPNFVPPPATSIIEGWVARGEVPAAIVQESATLSPAPYTVLLHQLPPEDQNARVLLQTDYWPIGTILTYDDAQAELVQEQTPISHLERVPPGGPPPR